MPRSLSLLLLASFLAGCSLGGPPRVPAQAAAGPAPAPSLRLLAAEPIEVEIDPGERHRYRLDLPAGRWISIELWQRQSDLDLRIVDPNGHEVAAATAPGNWSKEIVDVVTVVDGLHVIEIAAAGTARTGSYRLRMIEERLARPDDDERIAALRERRELVRRLWNGDLEPEVVADRLRRFLDESTVDWLAEDRAEIALDLGDALLASKAADEAAAAYRSGLDALASPPNGTLAAELLRGAGRAAQEARRMEEAGHFFRQAVEVALAAGDQGVIGSALNNEARFLHSQGQIQAAIERATQAADAKHAAGDLDGEVTIRLNLATILFGSGDRSSALAQYERTEVLAREAVVEDLRTRLYLALNAAILYRAAGEVEHALTSLRQALDLVSSSGDENGQMLTQLHLGALLNQLGDYSEARALLLRASTLARSGTDNDRAAVAIQLGWAELGEGEVAAARERLLHALDQPGLRADLEIKLLHAAGTAEIAAGEHDAARRRLLQAVELAETASLRVTAADLHWALGSLHLDAGDLDAAASALGQSAAIAAEIADPLRRAAAASLLARVAAGQRDPAAALQQALAAIALREEVRSRIVEPSLRASFLARWRGDFDLAIEMLLRLSRSQGDDDHLRQAFQLSEAAHARTLSELLAEARVDVRRGIAPELLAAERNAARRLSLIQSELTDALVRAAGGERIAKLENDRWEAQRELEAVETHIRRRHLPYADIHHARSPGVEEVQDWLAEGTALLEYSLGARSSVLFIVTREEFHALHLPRADEIGRRVAVVRDLIGGPPLLRSRLADEIAGLTHLLLAPAAEHLTKVDHVLVVPDRDLFYLPFEALGDPTDPVAAPGGLLRRWTVTYLPSAAVLAHLIENRSPDWDREVLLLADPPPVNRIAIETHGDGSPLMPTSGLAALPGARREAEDIAALFPRRADLFLGEAARESLLKTPGALAPARRLHIASHSHVSDADPTASYVLLAPDGDEDGLLQIHEVFNLELAAELVVLSGCETALGRRVEGEGLLGLARGFLYAGARQLIVSLWPVSDTATADLMVDLYRHIIAGLTPAEALRRAKLTALGAGAAPAVWAAFVAFAPPPPPPARGGSR